MIREATSADIPVIVEMARRFHEAREDRFAFNPEDTARFAANLIASPVGVVLISERGFISGAVMGAPGNAANLTAHELFWWAEDRQGLRLLRAFEEWARDMGCADVVVSFPAGDGVVGRILERGGYEPETMAVRKGL